MKMKTGKCVGFIAISILISCIFALSVNLTQYELGALYNMFVPPIIGIGTIILFLIANPIVKSLRAQIIILIICAINLYTGTVYHFEINLFPFVKT